MKKRHRKVRSNLTLLPAAWKQRNTVNVFPLKPGPLLPWKKQFLVHPCHTVQRKDLQSSSPSRHVEMLSPGCQVLLGSTAQASNGYFKFLDYNHGFPSFYNSTCHTIKERSLLNCHQLPWGGWEDSHFKVGGKLKCLT